jgi:hypothetical protein
MEALERPPYSFRVVVMEGCRQSSWICLGCAPAAIASATAVCRRPCGVNGAFGDHAYLIDFGSERKPVSMTIGWCRWYPNLLDFLRFRKLGR